METAIDDPATEPVLAPIETSVPAIRLRDGVGVLPPPDARHGYAVTHAAGDAPGLNRCGPLGPVPAEPKPWRVTRRFEHGASSAPRVILAAADAVVLAGNETWGTFCLDGTPRASGLRRSPGSPAFDLEGRHLVEHDTSGGLTHYEASTGRRVGRSLLTIGRSLSVELIDRRGPIVRAFAGQSPPHPESGPPDPLGFAFRFTVADPPQPDPEFGILANVGTAVRTTVRRAAFLAASNADAAVICADDLVYFLDRGQAVRAVVQLPEGVEPTAIALMTSDVALLTCRSAEGYTCVGVRRDGVRLATCRIGAEAPIGKVAVLDDGSVAVLTAGRVSRFDPSGREAWSADVESPVGLRGAGPSVLLTEAGRLRRFDATNEAVVLLDAPDGRFTAPAISMSANVVLACDATHLLQCEPAP